MPSTLFGAGLLAALAFIAIGVMRTRRHSENVGGLEYLLAFATLLILLAAMVVDSLNQALLNNNSLAVLAIGVAVAVVGGLIMRIETRQGRQPAQPRGLLALGVGVLLTGAALGVPAFAQSIPEPEVAIIIPTPVNVGSVRQVTNQLTSDVEVVSASDLDDVVSFPTPAVVLREISLPEMRHLVFSSPTPTPAVVETCEATVTTRLNLRDLPSTAAGNVIGVIDEAETVQLHGRTADSDWWYVQGDNLAGWLSADFLALEESCQRVSERPWR